LEDPGTDEDLKKESRMLTPYNSSRVAALNRGELHAEAESVRLATLKRVLCRTAAQKRTPVEMVSMRRYLTAIPAFAAMLVVALSAPIAVYAQDQPLPAEEQALAPAAIPGPAGSVEAGRVSTAQHALLSPNLGSLQEETLRAVVAAAMTWDQTSGYAVVEAIRAEPDVSVAPAAGTTADAASGFGAGAVNRVANAQHALAAGDLGSLQEDALTAIVATGSSWDDSSGYGALEAGRATIGHPVVRTTAATLRLVAARQALLSGDLGSVQEEALAAAVAADGAVELSSSSSLGADQHLSSCAAS